MYSHHFSYASFLFLWVDQKMVYCQAGNLDANSPVPDVEATRTTGAIFQISSS